MRITDDIVTPGAQDTEAFLTHIALPEDCTGMRVLDIGARDGAFTFEVERRGASEIIALDNVPSDKTGFAVAKELLGSKAEYVVDNVYNLNVERYGTFDLVLFFGVIYHLRHPLLALDRIWDVCNPGARMMVETHMIDEGLVDAEGNWHRMADYHPDLDSFLLFQFYPGRTLGNDFTSTWAPNQRGLHGIIESAGFDVTEEWRVAFRGGATGIARELDADNARAVDTAVSWDLAAHEILKPGDVSG